MKRHYIYLLLLPMMFNSCKKDVKSIGLSKDADIDSTKLVYIEQYRPQFHFSPEANWMNDPNGLVYNEGIYHLFYQYHPDDMVWGPMHWGHATSEDLFHWEHQEMALKPDSLGYIFSGSAVVDKDNTSGFGKKGETPMVAIFTYHSEEKAKKGSNDFQTQGIAYSVDNGKTWEKFKNNPVISNEGMKDFRDPKVFWNNDLKIWNLVLVAGDRAMFYKSSDLKTWELTGEFGKDLGNHSGVWECPDLFKLPVYGMDDEKWVLLISVNPGGPNGGSATQYFVGDFDGNSFTTNQTETKWLDLGKDNYAGVTYNNEPTANRILIGWMSNWQYAEEVPTEPWRSAMTLPRSLKLFHSDSTFFLKNYPIKNLDRLLVERESLGNINLEKEFVIDSSSFEMVDIKFSYNLKDDLMFKLSNEKGEAVTFEMAPEQNELRFNRDLSGKIDFNEAFASGSQKDTYRPIDEVQEIRLIVDRSSIEIFVNEGEHVFTNTIFPTAPFTILTLSSTGNSQLHNLKISDISGVWNK